MLEEKHILKNELFWKRSAASSAIYLFNYF